MALDDYIKKRKFSSTPEPTGDLDKENANRFVIQRHQARRLHYDLRLEMEGVLKSWAVPKGPSMNPSDKRLAIMTEDHPVKYLTFHGTIPKGNYGAGVMDIWDEGKYQVLESEGRREPIKQLKKGDLKIEFFGKKIKGTFALVRTQRGEDKNQWLLIKKKDTYSTDLDYDAEVFSSSTKEIKSGKVKSLNPNEFIKPMLASPAKKIFKDPDWIFELKWDGYRVLTNIHKGKVELYSRNGISYNSKFALLKKELESIPHDCILDGEVVIVDKKGKHDFQKLQNYNAEKTKGQLRYYIFDLLHLNGHDTISLPLLERKSLLPDILEGLENLLFCDHIAAMGPTLYERAIDAGRHVVQAQGAVERHAQGSPHAGGLGGQAARQLSSRGTRVLHVGRGREAGVALRSAGIGGAVQSRQGLHDAGERGVSRGDHHSPLSPPFEPANGPEWGPRSRDLALKLHLGPSRRPNCGTLRPG